MKKAAFLFAGVALLALVYTFDQAYGERKSPASVGDYIIIRYGSFDSYIFIHYGGDKVEEVKLTKEQLKNTLANNVVDQLSKFYAQGYELVSSTSSGPNGQVNCFLRKTK